MRKFIFMFALIVSAFMSANAQIATQNSKVLDNVGVGVTAGISTPLDFNSVFPFNTNVGLKVTKDLTPTFGFQLEGLAILNDNHFSDIKTAVKATNVGLNGAFNLTNMIWGYNGTPRFFEVSAVGGFGWLHTWAVSHNNLTAKTGLDLAFNLGNSKQHSIVVTPAVYWNLNKFDAVQFNKKGAQLGVNVSYVYHFKTSNGTHHFKTWNVGAMNDEINALKGKLEECENREPKVIEKIVRTEVPAAPVTNAVSVASVSKGENKKWIVPFGNGSARLTPEAWFILNQIEKGSNVEVTATATPTGTKEFNQKLSEARAKACADHLTERGVNVKSAVGKGVDATSGRTAVITVLK